MTALGLGQLDARTIQIDSQEYPLIQEGVAQALGVRRWQVDSVPRAVPRAPRPDVSDGAMPYEKVISYTRFDGGITGELENLPGCIHFSENCNGLWGGVRPIRFTTQSFDNTQLDGNTRAVEIIFNGDVFLIQGRNCLRLSGTVLTVDQDFGAGVNAVCACVHNDELVVGFGGSTNRIRSRTAAGVWTTATDATYADLLCQVDDRLVRISSGNVQSSIGSTENPLTLGNWIPSAGITVGDDDYGCTELGAYGVQIAVAKVDGLYLGNSETTALFSKVMSVLPDATNGKNMRIPDGGGQIYYPHTGGLLLYDRGKITEIGIPFSSGERADKIPSTQVSALDVRGDVVWAMTRPSGIPWALPTGVQKTVNNGVAYTDYSAVSKDGIASNFVDISSLDTVANEDWLIVGYSARFYGVFFEMNSPNGNTAQVTAEFWNGSAWTALSTNAALAFYDGTTSPLLTTPHVDGVVTFKKTGMMLWRNNALSTWASSTINGIAAFWIRFSVSAALDALVRIAEVRVITSEVSSYLWRGRPRRRTDTRGDPIIWETWAESIAVIEPTALLVVPQSVATYQDVLISKSRQTMTMVGAEDAGAEAGWYFAINAGESQRFYTAKHDGGTPMLNKQWLAIAIRGRNIDSNRDLLVQYRMDENTTWVTAQASVTASPTTISLTGITGRWMQLRITFNAFTSFPPAEVTAIELIYRELHTFRELSTFYIEAGKGRYYSEGGIPPSPDVVLSTLEALQGSAAVSQRGPARLLTTVNVIDVSQVELAQEGLEYPELVLKVRTAEV